MLMICLMMQERTRACPSLSRNARERLDSCSDVNLDTSSDLDCHPLWSNDSLTADQRKAAVQETPEQKVKREKKESEEAAILDQGKILWEARVIHEIVLRHIACQIRDALTKDCDLAALREMLELNSIDVGARPRDALVIVCIGCGFVRIDVIGDSGKMRRGHRVWTSWCLRRVQEPQVVSQGRWSVKRGSCAISSCCSSGYYCRGSLSEWEPCTVVTKTPKIEKWL